MPRSDPTIGANVPPLMYDAANALARSRGMTAGALVRELLERELAANSTEVAAAMADATPQSVWPVRSAMEEAFPRAKVLAELRRYGEQVARRGG